MNTAHAHARARPERILRLALHTEYFDAIKAGTKGEEYRLCTPYWSQRLLNREYDGIELTKGYPRRNDTERHLQRPWRGYTIKTLQHDHFGPSPVTVFAITVN